VLKSLPFVPRRVSSKLSTDQELEVGEQTVLRSSLESEKSVRRQLLSIGTLVPESAKIYAFLDIKQNELVVQRITITEISVIVGRVDPKRGITPEIDLTQFDSSGTVSRQHARIRLEKTLFSIEDLKSRNKTRLGELTLTPFKPELLKNGDMVSFGSVKATFRLLGTSELPAPWSQS
jgi:pSer/pThr/pTyr-binding forkhead associated (FHA) protein